MIIKQPDELLEGMSDWCKEHHGKVGSLCGQELDENDLVQLRELHISTMLHFWPHPPQ